MKQRSDRPVSRRTVARGAAWSLPVVAFAASAPAASASTATATCSVTVTGAGVKQVHGKTVTLTFNVQNAGATTQPVTIVSVDGPANADWSAPSPSTWQAAPGSSSQDVSLSRGNNANGDATVVLQVCGKTVTTSVYISK